MKKVEEIREQVCDVYIYGVNLMVNDRFLLILGKCLVMERRLVICRPLRIN